jgi:hypothetical protein
VFKNRKTMSGEHFFLEGEPVNFVDDAPTPLGMARAQALRDAGIKVWTMPSPNATEEEPRVALIARLDQLLDAQRIIESVKEVALEEPTEEEGMLACPACEFELNEECERCPECGIKLHF